MATIAFTAIGAAIGGPLGGIVGSAIGQRVDQSLLGGRPRREGPRLQELSVQTSSYGTQIPAIFGSMRVSGSVIWATDLIEKRSVQSGGKGRPSTTSYSYSVSFAVAVSSLPVARMGRIWAEGNLLRGADGEFKVETAFRFYSGHADQLPDPLIASAEGVSSCPAFRGLSYVVFENLQLADFGNRIPSLTFEIFEREGSVTIVDVASTVSEGLINGQFPIPLRGYAAQGDTARNALAPLIDAAGANVRAVVDRLELFRPDDVDGYAGPVTRVENPDAQTGGDRENRLAAERKQAVAVSLRYYDPSRDYQIGLQRSGWSIHGRADRQIDLPAALETNTARAIAQNLFRMEGARRDSRQLRIPISANRPSIGQYFEDPSMRALQIEHYAGFMVVDCERFAKSDIVGSSSPEPGRHVPAPDLSAGLTRIEIFELPSIGPDPATGPIVALAAGGTEAAWRRAAILRRTEEGTTELGVVEAVSAIGTLQAPIANHPANLIDYFHSLVVKVETNGVPPQMATGSPLDVSSPLLLVGDELVRYGSIEPMGNSLYAVRNLVRGFGNSRPAPHVAGERIVFVEKDKLFLVDQTILSVGGALEIEALGIGDSVPASRSLIVDGTAVRPLAPVHGAAIRLSPGDLSVSWIRRPRHDYGWNDGVDAASIEAVVQYEIVIRHQGNELFRASQPTENLLIPAAVIAGWGIAAGSLLNVSVYQVGTFARSDAFELVLTS